MFTSSRIKVCLCLFACVGSGVRVRPCMCVRLALTLTCKVSLSNNTIEFLSSCSRASALESVSCASLSPNQCLCVPVFVS